MLGTIADRGRAHADPSLLLLAALLLAITPSEPGPADPGRAPVPLRVDWEAEPSGPAAGALRMELARLFQRELRPRTTDGPYRTPW